MLARYMPILRTWSRRCSCFMMPPTALLNPESELPEKRISLSS